MPFRTVAELGQGGMGRVMLAVAPDGRLVAVKRGHPELAESSEVRARFRREVVASRKVSGAYTAAAMDADAEGQVPWPGLGVRSWSTLSQAPRRCGAAARGGR